MRLVTAGVAGVLLLTGCAGSGTTRSVEAFCDAVRRFQDVSEEFREVEEPGTEAAMERVDAVLAAVSEMGGTAPGEVRAEVEAVVGFTEDIFGGVREQQELLAEARDDPGRVRDPDFIESMSETRPDMGPEEAQEVVAAGRRVARFTRRRCDVDFRQPTVP